MVSFNEESPYVRMLRDHVPREYLKSVLEGLVEAYPLAHKRAYAEFEKPEAKNYLPARRRAIVEGMLRTKAASFGGDICATAEPDLHSGWWNHTRVVCGKRVALTQNKVPDPEHVVRHSYFREQYAQDNGQRSLFDYLEPKIRKSDNILFGILLHGNALRQHGKLGFAVVRFPIPDLSGYYGASLNLFREFPEVVAHLSERSIGEVRSDIELAPPEDVGDEPEIDFNSEDNIG